MFLGGRDTTKKKIKNISKEATAKEKKFKIFFVRNHRNSHFTWRSSQFNNNIPYFQRRLFFLCSILWESLCHVIKLNKFHEISSFYFLLLLHLNKCSTYYSDLLKHFKMRPNENVIKMYLCTLILVFIFFQLHSWSQVNNSTISN